MPLDTGAVAEFDRFAANDKDRLPRSRGGAALDGSLPLGLALRAARESSGLTVADIARATRVRPGHVHAIEIFDIESLPSRPFAIGYVRAYANVLGIDEDRAVGRFRAEAPDVDTELHGPGGISRHAPRRFRAIAACGGVILLAVLGWNFSRQMLARPHRASHALAGPAAAGRPRPAQGPAHLGAPLPAPPEATTPPVYETPGLAAAAGDASTLPAPTPATPPADKAVTPGAAFVAAGTVYGARDASGVLFQARNPTSLVVRGQNGAVYFARQLAAGEAWRAPAAPGLIVDVGNPASMEVFVAGVSRGALTAPQTPVSHFAD